MRVLELERALPAKPAVVFAALTEPDELARWWGPAGFTVPSLDFDARAGASYRIAMQPPEGAPFHLTGTFRTVEPPVRLAYTFAWDPPDPDDVETVAELSLRDAGDATEVTLRQGTFATDERLELHRAGWTQSFDRLDRLLRGARSA